MTGRDDTLAGDGRIVLRRLREADLDAFLGWRSDPEVARFQSWAAMDRPQALRFLRDSAQADLPAAGAWRQIAVALSAAPDRAIGDIGLFLSEDGRAAEIGISLSRAAQGQGIGRGAVRLAAGLLYRDPALERIHLWTDRRNLPAQAMIRAAGALWQGEEQTPLSDGGTLVEDRFLLPRLAGR